jgi:hypothetical protein
MARQQHVRDWRHCIVNTVGFDQWRRRRRWLDYNGRSSDHDSGQRHW